MTSDKNISENCVMPASKKIWVNPYFEIISRDKIKTGVEHKGRVEGSKLGNPGAPYTTTTYLS